MLFTCSNFETKWTQYFPPHWHTPSRDAGLETASARWNFHKSWYITSWTVCVVVLSTTHCVMNSGPILHHSWNCSWLYTAVCLVVCMIWGEKGKSMSNHELSNMLLMTVISNILPCLNNCPEPLCADIVPKINVVKIRPLIHFKSLSSVLNEPGVSKCQCCQEAKV